MSRSLRKAAWASKDLVEKWTILVDVGRGAVAALWGSDASSATSRGLRGPDALEKRVACDCWSFETSRGGLRQSVPYPMRLQVSLSLLMWVRCLRDVQDTLARLQQPYAPQRRLPTGTMAVDVFPTRLAERLVDPCSFVVLTAADPVEQLPLPHLIVTNDEDESCEGTVGERVVDRVRRAHGLPVRLSDDDKRANRLLGRSLTRRARQRASTNGGGGPSTSATAPPPQSPRHCDYRLDTLDGDVDADATYHGNMFRPEGSPLNDFGTLSVCPIFVEAPGVLSWSHSQPQAQQAAHAGALLRAFITAHTSILSSLFIEGRVVDFTSNGSVLVNYVSTVFEPLIQEGFLRVAQVHVKDNYTKRSAAEEGEEERQECRRPYVADWVLQHAWVVNPSVFTSDASVAIAVDMVRRSLCASPLVVVHSDDAKAALIHHAGAEARFRDGSGSGWQVRVVPNLLTDDGLLRNTLSRCFMVSILSPDTTWLRLQMIASGADPFVERVQGLLGDCCRLVAVNAFAMDLWAFYPHASALPQKVGNAFRIRTVRRSTLRRPWGRNWSVCAFGLDTGDVLRCCMDDSGTSASSKEEASNALRLERSLSFLAQPTRATALGLVSAKLLGF